MAIRKIININEEKCNGCGLCAEACHEGAIEMVEGKAKLVKENFCDGFGDCLPACPTGAITFEEREAPEYDEAAVKISKMMKELQAGGGCPGSAAAQKAPSQSASGLAQWPCQIKLVPLQAPFFNGADLLIAADCTAFAYADTHDKFMKGKITIIGCPKLDGVDYADKLTQILSLNDIKSVTVLRMEVPCCGGLQRAAADALNASGKTIPWQVITISRDGRVLE